MTLKVIVLKYDFGKRKLQGDNTMIIEQKFKMPLSFNDGHEIRDIHCRKWSNENDGSMCVGKINNGTQEMGYIGAYQIKEIWKHAGFFNMENSKKIWARVADENKPSDEIAHIYVSNYGYVAVFSKEEGERFCPNADGVKISDLPNNQKDILKKRNIVPENRLGSGCEICLNVLASTNNYEWDIHRLVATNFLEKESDSWGVHHIDNNSYNNSVTNLVWVTQTEHDKKLHPLTYK